MKRILVIGDGGWGTALGLTLLRAGHRVRIWSPVPAYAERVRAARENVDYLPGVPLPAELEFTGDRASAAADAEVAVLAVPTRFFRGVVESFSLFIPAGAQVVSVAKGLDPVTLQRMTEVAEAVLGRPSVAALSGPSFASEVAIGAPTAVTIAACDRELAAALQAVFNTRRFRAYTSDDVVGVELGGTLKNVVAVGVGVSDGLGLGSNARAALITRGLAEITRLGVALGAHPATFAGLSGMGDLVLTCTSRQSRNHTVGERIGRGEKVADILGGMKQVAEGVSNAATVRELAQARGVAVPVTDEVHAILNEGKDPQAAVEALLTRDPRPERDG